MAEALESKDQAKDKERGGIECAVCLQKCIHPAQLPCGHIFCFLCIKGFANQNKKCAMCRQEIPRDFTEHPNLLEEPAPAENLLFDEGYQWFYEGRNGWWQYDERTSKDLEIYYKKGMKTCELLIAGFLYIVDLENMLQIRRNDPSRRRKVKRDFATILKKGIAGLHKQKEIVAKTENPENIYTNVAEVRANLVGVQNAGSSQIVEEGGDTDNDVYIYEDVEDLTGQIGSVTLHPKRQ